MSDDSTCQQCGYGLYSLEENSPTCLTCPSNAECLGGMILKLDPGYWRTDPFSDIINLCYNRPENCLGGLGTGNQICLEGHIGALCK